MPMEREPYESLRDQRERQKEERDTARREVIWADRKRTIFGLPWSFTKYWFNGERLVIETGFFSRHQEVVRLYRIKDVSLDRSFGEILFGLGTITVWTSDASTSGEFKIRRVKCSAEVADALYEESEQLKRDLLMLSREAMGAFSVGAMYGGGMPGDNDGIVMFDQTDNML